MALNSGDLYTLNTDPLLILMAAEDETVQDEFDTQAQADVRESVCMAATFFVNHRSTSKE